MIKGLDHVAVAVRDLDEAVELYCRVLGFRLRGRETVSSQRVEVAFLEAGGFCLELVSPVDADSPVARFLERRGEGMHHVSLEVEDVEAALARARAAGCRLVDERPREGAEGKLVAFLHPKSLKGVLVELCTRR